MTHNFHAKTLRGLEQVLAGELKEIGADAVHPVNRGVDFSGSIALMYKANLFLRTALRILRPVSRFKAESEEQLYRRIMSIDWSEFMTYKNSFAVDAVAFSSRFRNSHFIELKVKDAIADQFRNNTSLRPSVDLQHPEIRINVHVQDTFFTVSLDSSGESLHKRGYRKQQHPASLNEVLAAGMILISEWDPKTPFINPMCGSGTLAIEAAMIAAGIFPGNILRSYGFQYWVDYDPQLFNHVKERMPAQLRNPVEITASDISGDAVRITKINAKAAGVEHLIKYSRADFMDHDLMKNNPLVILNPPYGERMVVENLGGLYSGIGSALKHKFPGSKAWILTANMDAIKHIGLKPDRKITLYNGSLECRFLKFSLFEGTRKDYQSNSI